MLEIWDYLNIFRAHHWGIWIGKAYLLMYLFTYKKV
jgi:hypothetical protein